MDVDEVENSSSGLDLDLESEDGHSTDPPSEEEGEAEQGDGKRKKRKRKASWRRKKIRSKFESVDDFNPEARSAQSEELERIRRLELQQSLSTAEAGTETEGTAETSKGALIGDDRVSPEVVIVDLTEATEDDDDVRAEAIVIDSGSESEGEQLPASKKPKRNVETVSRLNRGKYDTIGPCLDGRVLINMGHPEQEQDVFLASQIAAAAKPHQVGGIRFLYDNIIESLTRFQSSAGFGCILAHSMGLGKTLQVIGFIDIFMRNTSAKHVLCVVPVNTLQNWVSEFDRWLPGESSRMETGRRSTSSRSKSRTPTSMTSSSPMSPCRDLSPSGVTSDRAAVDDISNLPSPGVPSTTSQLISSLPSSLSSQESTSISSGDSAMEQASSSTATREHVSSCNSQNNQQGISPDTTQSSNKLAASSSEVLGNDLGTDPSSPPKAQPSVADTGIELSSTSDAQPSANNPLSSTQPSATSPGIDLSSTSDAQPSANNHGIDSSSTSDNQPSANPPPSSTQPSATNPGIDPSSTQPSATNPGVDPSSASDAQPSANPPLSSTQPSATNPGIDPSSTSDAQPSANPPPSSTHPSATSPGVDPSSTSDAQPSVTDSGQESGRNFRLFVLAENSRSLDARLKVISEWREVGGVLLIGYEMFRMLSLSVPSLGGNKMAVKKRKQSKKGSADNNMIDLDENEREMDALIGIQKALCSPGPDLVVCDEGHRIKNDYTNISQALKKIRTRRRIVMTGYPLQNNLMEYWCMVDFVRPMYLGTKQEFGDLFERPISNGQCMDSTPADVRLMRYRSHVLHKLLEGFVLRRGHEILFQTLPPKFEHVLYLRPSEVQGVLYEYNMGQLTQGGSTMSSGGVAGPLKAFAVCSKIWNHPDIYYEEAVAQDAKRTSPTSWLDEAGLPKTILSTKNSEPSSLCKIEWPSPVLPSYQPGLLANSPKMMVLMELIDQAVLMEERVLVFSQSLSTLSYVEKLLSQRPVPTVDRGGSIQYSSSKWIKNKNYCRLDGSTSSLERDRLINNFNSVQNKECWVFLLSTRAGCLGVNLVGANRVVVLDVSWNPCYDAQAVCRVYRYGQTKPCHIYRLVCDGTMEKKMYERQISKQGMADRVIDDLHPERHFTARDFVSLLTPLAPLPKPQSFSQFAQEYLFDPLMMHLLCTNLSNLLTKLPFKHESLLLDSADERMTELEKYIAMRGFQKDWHARQTQAAAAAQYRSSHHVVSSGQQIQQKSYQQMPQTVVGALTSKVTNLQRATVPSALVVPNAVVGTTKLLPPASTIIQQRSTTPTTSDGSVEVICLDSDDDDEEGNSTRSTTSLDPSNNSRKVSLATTSTVSPGLLPGQRFLPTNSSDPNNRIAATLVNIMAAAQAGSSARIGDLLSTVSNQTTSSTPSQANGNGSTTPLQPQISQKGTPLPQDVARLLAYSQELAKMLNSQKAGRSDKPLQSSIGEQPLAPNSPLITPSTIQSTSLPLLPSSIAPSQIRSLQPTVAQNSHFYNPPSPQPPSQTQPENSPPVLSPLSSSIPLLSPVAAERFRRSNETPETSSSPSPQPPSMKTVVVPSYQTLGIPQVPGVARQQWSSLIAPQQPVTSTCTSSVQQQLAKSPSNGTQQLDGLPSGNTTDCQSLSFDLTDD